MPARPATALSRRRRSARRPRPGSLLVGQELADERLDRGRAVGRLEEGGADRRRDLLLDLLAHRVPVAARVDLLDLVLGLAQDHPHLAAERELDPCPEAGELVVEANRPVRAGLVQRSEALSDGVQLIRHPSRRLGSIQGLALDGQGLAELAERRRDLRGSRPRARPLAPVP